MDLSPATTRPDVVLVHSSDVHVDDDGAPGVRDGDGTAALRAVLATARALRADVVLLAGDTFDSNQLAATTIERAGRLLAEAGMPVVILPGNHDPALPDAIYVRGGFAQIPQLAILGVTHPEAVQFPQHDLEIWGQAHRDYFDMPPLRGARPRSTLWQVAVGHGHYEPPETRANPLRPSWVFGDEEIAATGADYLALGHLGPADARRQWRRSGILFGLAQAGRDGQPGKAWCGGRDHRYARGAAALSQVDKSGAEAQHFGRPFSPVEEPCCPTIPSPPIAATGLSCSQTC
ncbi:MAG TPA: metallophosphoesterase [Stellaceae bacterium]|jgi:hypothetical protein